MQTHHRRNDVDAVEIRLLDLIRSLAAELRPRRADLLEIGLDASLQRDAGLDSLGRVEMITRIEKEFDVVLPEHVFAEAESPRDLLAAIERSSAQALVFTAELTSELRLGRVEAAPDSAQTLTEVLDWHADQHPDRPHIGLTAGSRGILQQRESWLRLWIPRLSCCRDRVGDVYPAVRLCAQSERAPAYPCSRRCLHL